jgi:hypothetical protein
VGRVLYPGRPLFFVSDENVQLRKRSFENSSELWYRVALDETMKKIIADPFFIFLDIIGRFH